MNDEIAKEFVNLAEELIAELKLHNELMIRVAYWLEFHASKTEQQGVVKAGTSKDITSAIDEFHRIRKDIKDKMKEKPKEEVKKPPKKIEDIYDFSLMENIEEETKEEKNGHNS